MPFKRTHTHKAHVITRRVYNTATTVATLKNRSIKLLAARWKRMEKNDLYINMCVCVFVGGFFSKIIAFKCTQRKPNLYFDVGVQHTAAYGYIYIYIICI